MARHHSMNNHDAAEAIRTLMQQPLDRPAPSKRVGFLVLIGCIGLLAGATGGFAASVLFLPFPPTRTELVRQPTRIGHRAVATYPALGPLTTAVVDCFVIPKDAALPDVLPLASRTGRGVALTTDGWVVTVRGALPGIDRASVPVVVGHNHEMRTVDRVAFDPASDLVFLHTTSLDATVLPLRERTGLPVGTPLFVPTTDGGVLSAALQSLVARRTETAVQSSDAWASFLRLHPASGQVVGSPVVDGDGAMVGLVMGDGLALPVDAIATALPSLFRDGAVTRNVLGARYHDRADSAYRDGDTANGIELVERTGAPIITPALPERGALRAGDRIVAVGEDPLTTRRFLPELIQEYPGGATVTLRGRRGAEAFAVEVTLGTAVGEVRTFTGDPPSKPPPASKRP